MRKYMTRFLSLAFAVAALFSLAISAYAQSNVSYNGKAKEFIFSPGTADHPTDLFDSMKDVMPGDVCTQTIVVKNLTASGKVKIFLRALGPEEGSEEFLSHLNLSIVHNGDKLLFDASADQTNGLSEWVHLGTFYRGGSTELELTLSVPADLGNEFQDTAGMLIWEFQAEEHPLQPGDPGYKTGDMRVNVLLGSICLCSLFMMILLIVKRRKEQTR